MRPADEEVRALAGEILQRPEFARWRSFEADAFMALERWISEYMSWINELQLQSPLLFWLFLIGLLGFALALIGHIVWSVRTALAAPAPAVAARAVQAQSDWAAEAERCSAQGRFLEGAHHLLLGSIEVLVRRGFIDIGRADANPVLRDQVRGSKLPLDLRAEFLRLLDTFEERWFRDRREDGDLFRDLRDFHSHLVSSARGPA